VGNATYGPQGLLYNSAVHETAGAGQLDYDDISKAVDLIRYRNHEPNAFVCDPGGAGQLDRLKASTAGTYLGPSRTTAQLGQFVTSAAAGNCFVGDWSQLWFFPRTNITIEVSREAGTAFANAQIAVRAYLRADVIAVAPAAFEVLPGLSS